MAEQFSTAASMTPGALLAALGHIQPDLPALLGAPAWEAEGAALRAQVEALRASDAPAASRRLAVAIVKIVARHPAARERLNRELLLLADLRRSVAPALGSLAEGLGQDAAQTDAALSVALALVVFALAEESDSRGIPRTLYTGPGGVGGGTVVRLRHLQFDAGELAELLAGAVLTVGDVVGTPHPLVILAGLLQIARSAQKILSVDVDEELTTVYWGLFHACGHPERCASLAAIVASANTTRQRYQRVALGEERVRQALADLARLHLAEPCAADGTAWRFLERVELR